MGTQQPGAAAALQLGLQLVQQGRYARLGARAKIRHAVGRHIALGIEELHQRGLQGVGQPRQPLVAMRTQRRAQRRHQTGLRVGVGQVQEDGGCFVDHQIAVHQHRNQSIGVEPQVLWRLLRVARAVHQLQLEGHAQLFQKDMRHQAGVAGVVVELQHGVSL